MKNKYGIIFPEDKEIKTQEKETFTVNGYPWILKGSEDEFISVSDGAGIVQASKALKLPTCNYLDKPTYNYNVGGCICFGPEGTLCYSKSWDHSAESAYQEYCDTIHLDDTV